jgi:hypothetical protein
MFSGDARDIEGLGALEDRGRNSTAGDVPVHRRDPRGANGSVTSLQIVQLPHHLPLTASCCIYAIEPIGLDPLMGLMDLIH